ncbi:hypothetical protein RSAG8_10645, partial [Rhizoctonia solani AG-8 WAC10335]
MPHLPDWAQSVPIRVIFHTPRTLVSFSDAGGWPLALWGRSPRRCLDITATQPFASLVPLGSLRLVVFAQVDSNWRSSLVASVLFGVGLNSPGVRIYH